MNTMRELFEHELRDIYYAENKLVEALGELTQEATDVNARQAFENHRQETRNHITRLQQVFTSMGAQPQAVACPGIEGIIKEKKTFSQEEPTPFLLNFYNLGAAAKAERYEISCYEYLIQMAQSFGMDQAVQLLRANLQEEQLALQTVQNLAKSYNLRDMRGGEGTNQPQGEPSISQQAAYGRAGSQSTTSFQTGPGFAQEQTGGRQSGSGFDTSPGGKFSKP